MANVVLPKGGALEYVPETTIGTFEPDATFLWPGATQKFIANLEIENEDIRQLKDSSANDKLQIVSNIKTGRKISADHEYYLQNWNLVKRGLSLTGGNSCTDSLSGLSIGLISPDATPKYAKFAGMVIDECNIEVPEKGIGKATLKYLGMDVDSSGNQPWLATDYIGSGSHVTEVTTTPVIWEDVSALTYGGSNIPTSAVGGIKLGYKNNLEEVPDVYATNATKVGAIEPTKREFSASIVVRKKAIGTLMDTAYAYTAGDLVVTINGTTITLADAKIPKGVFDLSPEGLSSVEIPFTGITNWTFS